MTVADQQRWQRRAAILGAIGLAACVLGGIFTRSRAFQAYWFAWIFWTGVGCGALSILLLRNLSGGEWGRAIAPIASAASLTLPLLAVLFIPALLSLGDVFPWVHPASLEPAWTHKREYLTPAWFIVRSGVYLTSFIAIALALRFRPQSAGVISGGGVLIFAGTMLFASTDWLMSLEPRWSSTMLVVIAMAAQFLSALSLCVIVVTRTSRDLSTKQLHDLGNLLLAFVTFWIYVSFSQFLIIWSGNLPREISWYLHRSSGGWQYFAGALALLQFAVPFALLLSCAAKQHRRRLAPIAALVFVASIAHAYWLIEPSFRPTALTLDWLDVAAFLGIGGCWSALFLNRLPHTEFAHA